MAIKITIELTEEQINHVIESRQPKKNNLSFSIIGASRELGISQSTIHRLIKDGFISTQIMGKSPRITQQEIERYRSQNNNSVQDGKSLKLGKTEFLGFQYTDKDGNKEPVRPYARK